MIYTLGGIRSTTPPLAYGCFAPYIIEFMEVVGDGFPGFTFEEYAIADSQIDTAWKMMVVLLMIMGIALMRL